MPPPFWSTFRADLEVNDFFDARMTLLIWRAGQSLKHRPGVLAFLARRVLRVADFLWTRGYIGADMPFEVTAGPRLSLQHAGRGVVLHPDVRLGSDVRIYHQVTLGVRDAGGPPVVGNGVFIGAGAKILGQVRVGDRSMIGANAVVVTDVPPDTTAVGVPAVLRPRSTPAPAVATDTATGTDPSREATP